MAKHGRKNGFLLHTRDLHRCYLLPVRIRDLGMERNSDLRVAIADRIAVSAIPRSFRRVGTGCAKVTERSIARIIEHRTGTHPPGACRRPRARFAAKVANNSAPRRLVLDNRFFRVLEVDLDGAKRHAGIPRDKCSPIRRSEATVKRRLIASISLLPIRP